MNVHEVQPASMPVRVKIRAFAERMHSEVPRAPVGASGCGWIEWCMVLARIPLR
jgi:hypothetical protein